MAEQNRTHEVIRECGGIVHSDGNIFFTNRHQFEHAASILLGYATVAVPVCSGDAQPLYPQLDAHGVRVDADWLPTAENINALPEPLRRYIAGLETLCDPAGIVRENTILKDCNKGLQAMYRKAADAGVLVVDLPDPVGYESTTLEGVIYHASDDPQDKSLPVFSKAQVLDLLRAPGVPAARPPTAQEDQWLRDAAKRSGTVVAPGRLVEKCDFPVCAVHHICERNCERNAGVTASPDETK